MYTVKVHSTTLYIYIYRCVCIYIHTYVCVCTCENNYPINKINSIISCHYHSFEGTEMHIDFKDIPVQNHFRKELQGALYKKYHLRVYFL